VIDSTLSRPPAGSDGAAVTVSRIADGSATETLPEPPKNASCPYSEILAPLTRGHSFRAAK
jgi:hypothetical protein